MDKVKTSIQKLLAYIESEAYMGYDPYDALDSPLFQSVLFKPKYFRFGIQQFVKRVPINLRPLLKIKKGYNPVTLGLCIQAYSGLLLVFPSQKSHFENKIISLISELKRLISHGFHGACWGYDFYWQARYAEIPAYQPNVVATGIIANSLYFCYKVTGNIDASALCISAADFVLQDLKRSYDGSSFCFSYSPYDKQQVYNASAKGVRVISHAYALTRDESLKTVASDAVKYILKRQQPDGSWNYSEVGRWVDSYHTGYILDCLHEYIDCTDDTSISDNLIKGIKYYRENFFSSEGIPKLFPKELYPIDCTSAGQALLTLSRFKDEAMAMNVAHWMIENMQAPEGFFYYRKYKIFTNHTSFMRWSNAWMIAGLSSLLLRE